jgi:hypothetical protein
MHSVVKELDKALCGVPAGIFLGDLNDDPMLIFTGWERSLPGCSEILRAKIPGYERGENAEM